MHSSEGTCIVEQTQESGSWWTTIAKGAQTDGGGFCLFESVLGCRLSFPLPLSSSVFSSFHCSPTDMFQCSEAWLKYSSQRPIFAIVPVSERVKGTKEQKLDGLLPRTHTFGRDHLMVGVVCLHHRLTMDAIIHCKTLTVTWGAVMGDATHTECFAALLRRL